MALYLGIDIGTSASKGVLIDDRCDIVCQASCGHETDNPCDGWYQHDAEAVWWGDFCRLSRELVARSGVNAAQIGCVGHFLAFGATVDYGLCGGRVGGAANRFLAEILGMSAKTSLCDMATSPLTVYSPSWPKAIPENTQSHESAWS